MVRTLTYASTGVDRRGREKTRHSLASLLTSESGAYSYGKPVELPFGLIFPTSRSRRSFYDLQIEGVGTKVLIAELADRLDTVGIDAVAMAVNDVIRSGANPLLISDAVHIARSKERELRSILEGVRKGAALSGAVVCSGETGDVAELLHPPLSQKASSFDLFVSALGVVERGAIIRGRIREGDIVVGIESSGIHSNGVTLARKLLLKQWGGSYALEDRPEALLRSVGEELLEPTRIYVRPLLATAKHAELKAAIHISGDGFAKFKRLLHFQGGQRLDLLCDRIVPPPIFGLIQSCAQRKRVRLTEEEMFRTFNMGYGFAVVVGRTEADTVIDSFNRYFPSKKIARVVNGDGRIHVENALGKLMAI